MLQLNGIKCWVTTSNNTILLKSSTCDNIAQIATCTVKLPSSKKSYIIHWSSSTPITAWCELSTKNSFGKINEGIVKCEMDANDPNTQKRSTQEYNGTGRNLSFAGRRPPNSPVLGMAWLEIRRATSIDVNEVSTRERKLTIHWVTSDRPDSGTPYATFIFNFELSEQAMERINGGLQSNPTTPSTRGRIGARSSSAEGETEGAIPSSPDIMMDDIPIVESLIEPETSEPVSADTEKPTILSTKVAKGPVVENPLEDKALSENPPQATKEPAVENPPKIPNEPIVTDHNDKQGPVAEPTTTKVIEVSNGSQKRTHDDVQSENAPEAKRLRSDATELDEEVPELLADISDEEADDFDSKIEIIDTEIETIIKSLKRITEKKEYMEINHKRVQSITDIKALETICGPLASRRPAQDKWDNIEGEDPDDEDGYSARRMHIQEALPSLEAYLSALKSKKIYLEKKAKLKRLRLDFEALEQRCSQISADITDMISKSPVKTPNKILRSNQ